jgi:TPR repeat protein
VTRIRILTAIVLFVVIGYFVDAARNGKPALKEFQYLGRFALIALKGEADEGTSMRIRADLGFPNSQEGMGRKYDEGLGVDPDPALAAQWYRKAADQGRAGAQAALGRLYMEGRGVPKDPQAAADWTRKAAEQGLPHAQFMLAILYHFPEYGLFRNDAEAFHWFRAAAQADIVQAQRFVGTMLLKGEGVTKNEAEGLTWLGKAAGQGDAEAMFALGNYYNCEGCPQDNPA